jgi:hypothetical protein
MAYTGSTAGILSNYDEVLKTFYLPAIQEQLNQDTILADLIDVNEMDVSGKNATIEMHYGRSSGTGSRADGGELPEADYQKHKTATVPMKYHYGRVTFSGPTIAATRDEKGSYARVIDSEINGIVKDLQKEVNRQLWGCGYGVLGRWYSGDGSGDVVLQKRYSSNAVAPSAFGSTFGGKYIKENGAAVPVVLGSSTSVIVSATVDADSYAFTGAVTEGTYYDTCVRATNPTVTEAAGTFLVRPASMVTYNASNNTGGARLEMMGLRGIVTDEDLDEIALRDDTNTSPTSDTLQGLDADTYAWWRSYVNALSGTRYSGQVALSFKEMQKCFDKVEEKVGTGAGPNVILTTRAIRREYAELCEANRRTTNMMELDGGWKGLEFSGIPIIVDNDAIDGEMYFLTTSDLQIYRMSDYAWMEKDGAVLARITGYDAYEAVLFRYAELGCRSRQSHAVLCDILYD